MVRFVVMAAGQATRMGRDKLALPWLDTTVLGYVLETVCSAIEYLAESSGESLPLKRRVEIRVIARHPIEDYVTEGSRKTFHSLGGTWLQVPKPQPLAETIRWGLEDLDSRVQTIGFLPGDQIGITTQELATSLQKVIKLVPDFLVPVTGDKTGSPVFFHRQYVQELRSLQGEQGGRDVLSRYPERWLKHTVSTSFLLDVDTPEEYQTLRKQQY